MSWFTRAAQVEGKTYAISHWAGSDEGAPPVHVVGCGIPWTELSDDSPDVVRQKSKDYQESRTQPMAIVYCLSSLDCCLLCAYWDRRRSQYGSAYR